MCAVSVLELPVTKEWEIDNRFEDSPTRRMIEFRLVYQGLLKGEADSKTKHEIRRYFHPQLMKLWGSRYNLRRRAEYRSVVSDGQTGITINKTGIDLITDKFQMGGQKFVPLVQKEWDLCCALDILLLRQDDYPTIDSGDLDGRVKTLLDALRVPQPGQYCEGEENPLYCLLEDDKLVSDIRVSADMLLCLPEQIVHSPKVNMLGEQTVRKIHALALIHVKIKPTHVSAGNMDFL